MSTLASVYDDGPIALFRGDCREVMASLPDDSVDAIVTDPPYELGFMGKGWDSSGIAYDPTVWSEAFRVLKPGGHALVFGGTRTWHRVAVAVEDAGFEIRDSLAWLHGQGFPKSMDVAKAITGLESGHGSNSGAIRRATMRDAYEPSGRLGNRDGPGRVDTGLNDHELTLSENGEKWRGWGTAVKPAFEPVVMARKPLAGTVAATVLEHGTGALNVAASRIGSDVRVNAPAGASTNNSESIGDGWRADARATVAEGRFPSNVLLDESQAIELDKQSGVLTSGMMRAGTAKQGKAAGILGEFKPQATLNDTHGDSGGASRFFYVAKAGKSERPVVDGHQHATVKPLALMRYLVRMVTPPGGTVLEPFAGSGTTIEAAVIEGFNVIAAELDEDGTHIPLIMKRIGKSHQQTLFGDVA